MLGLYFHIPFCERKCPYCDFYSIDFSEETTSRYIDALKLSMRQYANMGYCADTIYFGGGTPSLIPPHHIADILDECAGIFKLSENIEITLEANPNSANKQKLEGYKAAGVNRLSFGIQSASDNELTLLGRLHDRADASNAVTSAHAAGFSNISADIMLGTPYQTEQSALQSIDYICSLGITHVSAYMLKIEPNTPYYTSPLLQSCCDDDTLADIYLSAVKRLEKHGFMQYEISNFAAGGMQSRHNLKYWRCEEYLGFGPSAHSYLNKKRFCFPRDIEGFMASPQSFIITDECPGGMDEYVMLGLRLCEGIDLELFDSLFSKQDKLLCAAKKYITQKLMAIEHGRLYMTPQGFLLSSFIIGDILNQLE